MSEYQKYLDCEHIWFPKTNWDVAPQTCNRCGIDVLDWKWVQKIAPIEAQRDELLVACEALLDEMAEADKDWCLLCERATGHDDWCACTIAKAAIANVKETNASN